MKLSILKDHLNDSIQHVTKAISNRTTIPILSGIKIDASSKGMTLTGSDTDISIQSFIPNEMNDLQVIQLSEEGSVVLPAKFFSEIVRKLPSQEIDIEVNSQFQTTIRSGSSEIQLVGLDPEEYPLLPTIEGNQKFTIASDLLKIMIRQTVFSVSVNESTPILTGVLWTMSEGVLKFTACDRHRLAARETHMETTEDLQFHNIVISGKTLSELNKLLPDQNVMVDLVIADNQILIKIDSILFYSRILDGTYPDTSKLIPQSFQTELTIHTKSLMDAIDRAYLLSREDKTNIVKFEIKENKTVEISSASTELGKVTEQIDILNIKGDMVKISFNSKYMLDALKATDSEYIQMGFTGPMQPIIVKPEDQTRLLHLILPYRTTN